MIKLLVVDDEDKIRNVVIEYSQAYGYECASASDGQQALDYIKNNEVDIIILDIMMPNLDGFSACREIKKIVDVPIIMLSARQEEFDKLLGFELGIDDYVTKPFSPKELMARVKVVYDRFKKKDSQVYRFEGLSVDVLGRNVFVKDEKISITPKEFDLLLFLIKHQNQVLSREVLLDKVWNYTYYGDDRTIDTHVKMLRHSLGEYRDYIVTVRGVGYKFEV